MIEMMAFNPENIVFHIGKLLVEVILNMSNRI